MSDTLTPLIEASDLAGLTKHVDGVCARRDWDELISVRDRCEEAVKRGKQVWAIAQFAEYRLALEAPPHLAASMLSDGKGRFALGPLWEVAASTHTWAELREHIEVPTVRAMTAHERSIRGDAVDESEIDHRVLGVPVSIQGWEPKYPVADYRSDRAAFPDDIFDIDMEWIDLPDAVVPEGEDAVCE
ncbi:MAG: hypothetical protein M3094_09320, partial [Actinomycetia bacterium]|nr:hypothetical protein [Actinomycetes bacterium]